MAVSSVNITIQKGTNFSETFILFDDDGRLLDLSNFTENGVLNVIAKLKKYHSFHFLILQSEQCQLKY